MKIHTHRPHTDTDSGIRHDWAADPPVGNLTAQFGHIKAQALLPPTI